MELLQILGWIYLGVMLGSVFGVMALSLFIGPKIKQYMVCGSIGILTTNLKTIGRW